MSDACRHSDTLLFVVTPRLQAACRKCLGVVPKSSSTRTEIRKAANAKLGSQKGPTATIHLSAIKTLSRYLREMAEEDSDAWVHRLLRGSHIYIEAHPSKPRNPELAARLDKIKRQLEEQEYRRMTAGISVGKSRLVSDNPASVTGDCLFPAVPGVRVGQAAGFGSIKQEMGVVNQQISTTVNILFSGLGVGFAVAYASYTLTPEIGYRVLLGLGSAILVILAETWLFVFSGSRGQKKRLNTENLNKKSSVLNKL